MKWKAIALGVGVLALIAGALVVGVLTITMQSGGASARESVTSPDSFAVGGVKQTAVTTTVPRRGRPASACQRGAGDESDPTGDDRSSTRRTSRACPADNQAGDNQAGDRGGDNQAGDRGGDDQAGDRGGDNQAGDRGGDNQAGDRGGDNQAGDNQRGGD